MKFEFSAGGVVYRKIKNQKSKIKNSMEILVCQHSQHHGWVFPKGLIGNTVQNESKENTALREVEEETGAKGKILEALTPVTYWYQMDGVKRKKTVYYFLMEYTGGDITKHDHEMEQVEWIAPDYVAARLTYPGDRKVWKEARALISKF